jgi:hypothetical protein
MTTASTLGEQLFSTVVDAARLVLQSCKGVTEAMSKANDPDGLGDATERAEQATASLTELSRSA